MYLKKPKLFAIWNGGTSYVGFCQDIQAWLEIWLDHLNLLCSHAHLLLGIIVIEIVL
jgi:hypothetical protein